MDNKELCNTLEKKSLLIGILSMFSPVNVVIVISPNKHQPSIYFIFQSAKPCRGVITNAAVADLAVSKGKKKSMVCVARIADVVLPR